jgi:hypothetical protein
MSPITKILAMVLSFWLVVLTDLREWWGHVRQEVAQRFLEQEYQLPDDHTHSEDSQPALAIQMATQEIAPPPIPFVPDDDSQMYGAFLLPQQGHSSPYMSYIMESE